jgi:hypothetical protein
MKKGKIYVCNEVLVSPKFRVQAFTKSGQELELEIPKIQEILQGKLEVEREKNAHSRISIVGEKPLAFAASLHRIQYEKEKFTLSPKTVGKVLKGDDELELDTYKTPETFLDI